MNPEDLGPFAARLRAAAQAVDDAANWLAEAYREKQRVLETIAATAPQAAELADSVEKLRAEKSALERAIADKRRVDLELDFSLDRQRESYEFSIAQLKADAEREAAAIMAEKKERARAHIEAMAALTNAHSAAVKDLREIEAKRDAAKAD